MSDFSTWSLRRRRSWMVIYIALLLVSFLISASETTNSPTAITPVLSSGTLYLPETESNRFRDLLRDELNQDFTFDPYSDLYHTTETGKNYSASAKATGILKNIPDSLSFDVIAYGFGALIASELAVSVPGSVRSVVLVNPVGITEYELLGGTHLNRAVYAVKALSEWSFYYLIPHFGWISKDRYLNARAFLDTDYARIRMNYGLIRQPVRIILDESNGVYNDRVALEIHRLIPQSELVYVSENSSTELLLTPPVSSSASALREVQSRLPFSNELVMRAEGWTLLGLMLLIIFSTFVSEDLTCIGAGLMAARGIMGFMPAMLASLIGIFVGDILLYLAGRWLGAKSVRKAPFKWFISEKDLERSYHWFEARGPAIIIASRFIPGTRFPTYFSAGIIGASFWMFILYFGVASLLWTPALVGLAMIIGQELIGYFYLYQEYAVWVLLGVISVLFLFLKLVVPLYTYRGRRLLYGKFKRILNWEFWPSYVIYTPVVIYMFRLWMNFGKSTVFTASNPAIEDSGFIGESKSSILSGISLSDSVACFIRIDHNIAADELWLQVQSFMAQEELSFPIVLKPDRGERGKGVRIIHSEDSLRTELNQLQEDHILQEFIKGKEYGVFYYRMPGQINGKLFSITRKELLQLRGDGIHTLEQLILKDPRAVCLAQVHFDKHFNHLYEVPPQGEIIKLVELGTHARGALFYDDSQLITPELTAAIDEISKSFEGFFFGRYDIKVPSEEDLKEGRGLKVIELNGVTSESTNIYDPRYSYWEAIGILCQQWRIAFEIGRENYSKGYKLTSLLDLLKKIRA